MALIKKLLTRFKCWQQGHFMCLDDIGLRDEAGKLHWPCQRCGTVQVLDYGLQAIGQITVKSLKEIES